IYTLSLHDALPIYSAAASPATTAGEGILGSGRRCGSACSHNQRTRLRNICTRKCSCLPSPEPPGRIYLRQTPREGRNRSGIRPLHNLRGKWLLSVGRFAESEAAYEQGIAMGRESGLPTPDAEIGRALAQAKQGKIDQARETAERIALLEDPPEISLAELFLALGDRTKALEFVARGYRQAWADGMPYVDWRNLQRCRAVFEALREPEPQLPPFDRSKATPLPFEAEVRAFIEELKAKKKKDPPSPTDAAEPT